jgi:hypothetical protein
LLSFSLSPHSLPPLSPRGHRGSLLLYSPHLSAFLCLYYPLNSPPHAPNKLYSILYCVAGPSGGRGCLSMGPLRHPLPNPHFTTPP